MLRQGNQILCRNNNKTARIRAENLLLRRKKHLLSCRSDRCFCRMVSGAIVKNPPRERRGKRNPSPHPIPEKDQYSSRKTISLILLYLFIDKENRDICRKMLTVEGNTKQIQTYMFRDRRRKTWTVFVFRSDRGHKGCKIINECREGQRHYEYRQ